jgi:hypothetical protein
VFGWRDVLFLNEADLTGLGLAHDDLVEIETALQAHGHWHALRQFAVSTWIERGAQPKTVQTWAGHATLQLTMDTCGRLFPSNDHSKLMDAISKELFS